MREFECNRSSMQTVCPNCRHTYQNDIHSICPPCYEEKVKCPIPVVLSSTIHLPSNCSPGKNGNCKVNINATYDISLSSKPQQRLCTLLSSGSFKREKSEHDKTSTEKSKTKSPKDMHSPTASLSFLLPPSIFASCRAFNILEDNSFYNSEEDLRRIAMSQKYLKISGFYHQQLSWKEARNLLMPTKIGTFLVRDSSDSKYLYSLSIQTKCGPTSIRIHYAKGEFRLDSDQKMVDYLPTFPCILKLIQFYIDSTKKKPLKCSYDENQIWIDCLGSIYSQIVVSKPLYTKNFFPSLKHLSRLCINKHLLDTNLRTVVPAPSFVVNILQEYPYKY